MKVEDLLTTLNDCTFSTVKIGHSIGTYTKLSGESVSMMPKKVLKSRVTKWYIHYAEGSEGDCNYIFIKTF